MRSADSVAEWLHDQRQHPLEVELAKIQQALDALEACPPLRWADKLLPQALAWFYQMREGRIRGALDELIGGNSSRCPRRPSQRHR
jgi:hypothetical protein